jgi:single-stranded-DNA-specific exonuclease
MSSPLVTDHAAWAINPYSWRDAERLTAGLGVPLVAGMVLAGRGFSDPEEARRFLDCTAALPDPFLFGDMEAAVATISRALAEGRRIIIHGDYDADGITATAVMLLGLRDLGREAEWYLPSRFNEGYGLSRQAVETIASAGRGARGPAGGAGAAGEGRNTGRASSGAPAGELSAGPAVLITVDCGVNYPDEVEYAKSLGLEVVVVDHHRPGPRLPDCSVIHEVVGDYPHGDLCGVGLALKVLHALHIQRSGAARDVLPEPLRGLLDLVAIGTVADLAPLRGENRYYVKEGLKLITIGQRLGVRVLSSIAGCTGAVDSGTVAYRLAPRLNAAGRLADPSPPLRLLLSEDEKEASHLAAELHELNGARQDVERQILEEAVKRVEALDELPPALVVAGEEWHEGVVGIVASRLVERYHRPALLLGIRDGVAKGSGRSISAYDLMSGLNACADHLTVYGGHRQAVGLTLEASRVDEFARAMEAHAGSMLEPSDFIPVYRADAVVRGEDINADTAAALAALGPFGTGNPRPRLLLMGAEIRQAEVTRTGGHLRCLVELDGVKTRGIGFGMGEVAAAARECPGPRLLGAQLRVDEWQGTLRPELLLERVGPVGDCGGASWRPAGGCAGEGRLGADGGQTVVPGSAPPGSGPGAPPPCLGEGEPIDLVTLRLPPARDLRGARSALSGVAQILASGERVLLLVCSLPQALDALRERLPLCGLWDGQVVCAGRGSGRADLEAVAAARVAVVEWEMGAGVLAGTAGTASAGDCSDAAAASAASATGGPYAHVVALDPPYRAEHVALLRRAEATGALLHLAYGDGQRRATACLLRYLVHPRFAMVCLYRAMQEEPIQKGGRPGDALFARAAERGWKEARVVLTEGDLARAAAILEELGVEPLSPGGAKLEARSIAAYAAAERDYEECSRNCLTL